MKKTEKGTPGYLSYKKRIEIIRTIIYFGIVAAIFLLGYFQTKNRLNLFTVAAVLGCLPAAKALVGVIVRLPYRSVDKKIVSDLSEKAGNLTACYDLVFTSTEKIMAVDCIVVSGSTIFGYTHYAKTDPEETQKHIKNILDENGFTGFTVRILREYKPFLARAEGLDHIAAVEKADTVAQDKKICAILLNVSL